MANPVVDTADESQVRAANERRRRHYEASPLPVFQVGVEPPAKQDDLKWLYGEICSSWRMLTDVRFKLLGFVPTVSVVILISLLSRDTPGTGLTPMMRMAMRSRPDAVSSAAPLTTARTAMARTPSRRSAGSHTRRSKTWLSPAGTQVSTCAPASRRSSA